MSVTNESTANLSSEEKRALLARLLRERASTSELSYPLSRGQQALWFLYQLAPESVAYNVMYAWRICSNLDVSALFSAFQALVDQHPSLRTTYTVRDGKPVQEIHQHQAVHFEAIDASAWDEGYLSERLTGIAHTPFDLERGPVLRVYLFARSLLGYVLLLTAHHIAIDGWSLEIFLDELGTLYDAVRDGTEGDLSSLDLQYTDYVRWQARMLAGPEGERLWSYWQQQLGGDLPILDFPTERSRPRIQTYRGASHAFSLSRELTQRLKALAKAEGTTLYTILLAAFQVLLYRYTGQEDILVGSPVSGRSRPEFMRIVGYFVNMVPLRASLSSNSIFKTFLRQMARTVLEALDHQDYPFSLLVDRLQPKRDPSRSPLFQVVFVLQKAQRLEMKRLSQMEAPESISPLGVSSPGEMGTQLNLGGLVLESFPLEQQIAPFDLELEMVEVGGMLSARLQYNMDLFEEITVARMAGHFQTLLEGIVADPEQRIGDLAILTGTEQHQLLVAWNDTRTDYPQDRCIHELFEAQVEQTPDAVAVMFEEQSLTYRELNRRANKLARYLRGLGVGPEVLVGIHLGRSLEMVTGILGILKAGGAYVPLDLDYPQERLLFMLEDTGSSVVLSQKRLPTLLSERGLRTIYLDTEWEAIVQESEENLTNATTAENLAYVMYTSGSTGRPKGVSVVHRGVVRLVKENHYADLSASEIFLQFAPPSFDASTFEIWGALLNGARLVIFPRVLPSLKELGRVLQEHQVTTLWLTAGLFHLMVDERFEDLKHVRQLLAGGDVLSVPHVRKVQVLQGCRLVNGYGPTENTTFTTCHLVASQGEIGTSIPIGRPIANTQVYVLGPDLQLVPIGVWGELYTGGDGLARGYLNRSQLTAERFLPHPFSENPGARLYRTGDVVRYLSNGDIEFLGRLDRQVKIRGFRVELGEVEAMLAQHPGVQKTVVLTQEREDGNKYLVAYVVAVQGQELTEGELRHFLGGKLPGYMLPSAFVVLKELPLTRNGKVDRQALLAMEIRRPEMEAPYAPPSTDMERTLARIWQEVLNLERVDVHDSFFDLGGNSLLVIKAHGKLQEILERDLPMVYIFQYPTISSLAKYLSQEPVSERFPRAHDRARRQIEALSRQKQVMMELRADE